MGLFAVKSCQVGTGPGSSAKRGRRLRKESKTRSTHTRAGSEGSGGWQGVGVVGVVCTPCSPVRKRQQMHGGIFYQKTQNPSPGLASASLGAAFPATRSPAPLQNSCSTHDPVEQELERPTGGFRKDLRRWERAKLQISISIFKQTKQIDVGMQIYRFSNKNHPSAHPQTLGLQSWFTLKYMFWNIYRWRIIGLKECPLVS